MDILTTIRASSTTRPALTETVEISLLGKRLKPSTKEQAGLLPTRIDSTETGMASPASHCLVLHIQQGEYPKVISERLGHASTAFTNDLYGHLMPGMEQAAAAKVGAALEGVIPTPE